MGVFIAMYIGFVLIASSSYAVSVKRRKLFVAITCFIMLWLIQALRATSVGHDTNFAYLPIFENCNASYDTIFDYVREGGFEWGYQIYMRIIKLFISSDPNVFLAVVSFSILAPISYIFYKYSKNVILSFVIFASLILYHFSFSGLRQSIAFALTFYSYKYVVKENIYKFLSCVAIASLFHISAIVFAIVYFFRYLKLDSKKSIVILILWSISLLFLKSIILYLTSLIFGADKYSSYIEGNVDAYTMIFVYLFVFVVLMLANDSRRDTSFYLWMALATFMIQCLGLISNVADRIGYYFLCFYSLSIPQMIENNFNNKATRLIINVLSFIALATFFILTSKGGYLDVVPYKFFWE